MFAVMALLLRMALDPVASSHLGPWLVGEPELAGELMAICRRESHCRWVGAHDKDASAGPSMRRNALRVGWLDPACPWHHGDPRRFSTRGIHGMSAAYTLRFIGACVPPEVLDIPLVSATAAALRMQAQCRDHGACTRAARQRFWAGAAKYDRQRSSQPRKRT
jgi:hypothetical protein